MDTMTDNMWTFINPDTITTILELSLYGRHNVSKPVRNVTSIGKVNNDNFKDKHKNTICFKGPENLGHYVYVDENCIGQGTYENRLVHDNDDGMCHGAALFYALKKNGINVGNLNVKPKLNSLEFIDNYITLLNVYLYIIEIGWWNTALKRYFYKDVTHNNNNNEIRQTTIAISYLKRVILLFKNHKAEMNNEENNKKRRRINLKYKSKYLKLKKIISIRLNMIDT